jgi:hypothetical protein
MSGRWARLTGVAFVVLALLSFIVGGEPPDADAPGAEVIEFYDENGGQQQFSAGLGLWAAVLLVFFAGAVRSALRSAEPGRGGLSVVAFGGGVAAAVGIGIFSTLAFGLAEEADNIDPAAAQALHVLSMYAFAPLAIGVAAFLIAAGLASVRTGGLDSWLGWLAIVIGILAVTPAGFIGFLAFLAWTLVTSVMLAMRAEATATTPPPD